MKWIEELWTQITAIGNNPKSTVLQIEKDRLILCKKINLEGGERLGTFLIEAVANLFGSLLVPTYQNLPVGIGILFWSNKVA